MEGPDGKPMWVKSSRLDVGTDHKLRADRGHMTTEDTETQREAMWRPAQACQPLV